MLPSECTRTTTAADTCRRTACRNKQKQFLERLHPPAFRKVISYEQVATGSGQKLAKNDENLVHSCRASLHPDDRAVDCLYGDEGFLLD